MCLTRSANGVIWYQFGNAERKRKRKRKMKLATDLTLTSYELDSIAFYLLMYATDDNRPQLLKDEAIGLYDKIRGN